MIFSRALIKHCTERVGTHVRSRAAKAFNSPAKAFTPRRNKGQLQPLASAELLTLEASVTPAV
jgi:hypothetical protein